MSVVYLNRRHFLMGTGGFLLATPVLSSLLPRSAAAAPARAPRFIAFATDHGALWNSSMWPADSMLTETKQLYADHKIRRGKAVLHSEGNRTGFSEVLSASSGTLTSGLAAKLNLLRGLDLPFDIQHHGGGHLGNFAACEGTAKGALAAHQRPTIDQVMAWSPSFYKDLSTIKERFLHVGSVDTDPRFSISWGYENTQARTGVAIAPPIFSALEMFNRVFVPPKESGTPTRKPVVDRVLESYKRMRQGAFGDANRLSKADAQRLDDHMDRLHELQRTLNVTASCGDAVPPPGSTTNTSPIDGLPDDQTKWYQTFNDVIVAGMICGTTRIATVHAWHPFESVLSGVPWHNETVHLSFDRPDLHAKMVSANRRFFETVFLDLAKKLDVEEADDKTYLDNSLVMWSQESGMETHEMIGAPVITAGSAAGHFKTGHYVDYRNRDNLKVSWNDGGPGNKERRPGLLYNQWLANVLMSMGVPASEFEADGEKGYGYPLIDNTWKGPTVREAWPDRVYNDASKPMPFIIA